MLELAKRYGSDAVTAASIAEAQVLPVRFLENIPAQLRQAGVVDSVRGRVGGYRLSRLPRELSVGEIIRLMQGPLATVDCYGSLGAGGPAGGRECALQEGCVLLPVWRRAHEAMRSVYDEATFAELAEADRAVRAREGTDYVI